MRSVLDIPEWLQNHPELQSRSIHLSFPLKPYCVWQSEHADPMPYAVKMLNPEGPEAEIYNRLHQLMGDPRNHTLPCDVIRSERPFLIMPCLTTFNGYFGKWTSPETLQFFGQILKGLEFLHQVHIAHMDLYISNLIVAEERQVKVFPDLKVGWWYIIDFDRSALLPRGPGIQEAIDLPETLCKPPRGITRFDPYSWDVYCAGNLFKDALDLIYNGRPAPWYLRRLITWMIGEEKGCTTVCRCRPTAHRSRQVVSVMYWVARGWHLVTGFLSST